MKSLTDEQYQDLKDYAKSKGMALNGYQETGGGILLNNSLTSGVHGTTMSELRTAIEMSAQLFTTRK